MQKILIIDFGGQYIQLIARAVREQHVYCEIFPWTADFKKIRDFGADGIILSGGPHSVYDENAPHLSKEIFNLKVPLLGICYGMQYIAHALGGTVKTAPKSEYGKQTVKIAHGKLFDKINGAFVCWMSHTDYTECVPQGFVITAHTDTCPVAAMENDEKKIYGVQFHPEVKHTEKGAEIIRNFLFDVCKLAGDWSIGGFVENSVAKLKSVIGSGKVFCALSGGVDSAVTAALLDKAVGSNLICVFVDHGLMRKYEAEEVIRVFGKERKFNLIAVDAKDRFLGKLAGIFDPELKRKTIGNEFIRVFEEQAKKIGKVEFLAQGTIYPDVIESGGTGATIKSHHNVGGLPDVIEFESIVEPLRDLFKDEVRQVGRELELPASIVERQPFPGPGLGIRVIGEVTKSKLDILRETDFILREEIAVAQLDKSIWQYFTVLTDSRSVGVKGDSRTYGYTVALRAVNSTDGMTADWVRIPYDVLEKISNRICNEVNGVGRVVYDITSKPPATIEWE